jgi:predicted nucleic acid-binding protein
MSRKALVLDANILIRAVLGHKVRDLIMAYADQIDFFASNDCFEDARKYLPELLLKRGLAVESALEVLQIIERLVQPVEREWLDAFESQARL